MRYFLFSLLLLSQPVVGFQLIAHRGASFEAPENTLAAFRRGIELGATFVEMDIQLTKDGVPVVFHDEFVTRTTNCKEKLRIEELTLEELRKFDAGSWFSSQFSGEKVPTLEEVLQLDRETTGLMIEFKEHTEDWSKLAAATASVFARNPQEGKSPIYLASLFSGVLREIHKALPKQALMGLVKEPNLLLDFDDLPIVLMGIREDHFTAERARLFHRRGIPVWSFTIDKSSRAKEILSMGSDGVISNDPRSLNHL